MAGAQPGARAAVLQALHVGDLVLPVVEGGLDAQDAVLGDEAQVAHTVGGIAEERHEEIAGARQLLAHGFQAQVQAVLGVVPESPDEALQAAQRRGELQGVADDVIGRDRDDAEGDRVLAPGGQGVGVELLHLRRVVVMTSRQARPTVIVRGIFNPGGDAAISSGLRRSQLVTRVRRLGKKSSFRKDSALRPFLMSFRTK